jgi:hypothetical protein
MSQMLLVVHLGEEERKEAAVDLQLGLTNGVYCPTLVRGMSTLSNRRIVTQPASIPLYFNKSSPYPSP